VNIVEMTAPRLIVGLGNPGRDYEETRHNAGFWFCSKLAAQLGVALRSETRFHGITGHAQSKNIWLLLPQTFMNRSGTAVRALLERLGIEPAQCLVVYDDMDLPFGALRLRERGSPGTHNGMRSIVATLGTEAVLRLRIGISQASPGEATSHVLSEFAPDERQAVEDLVARAADAALAWAINGAAVAMNRYNKT
jgi:PTH1 family peptidyl-tRNA hydrolase